MSIPPGILVCPSVCSFFSVPHEMNVSQGILELACLCVRLSGYLSEYKMLISVKTLAWVLSHI